jgi:hypothetical protein
LSRASSARVKHSLTIRAFRGGFLSPPRPFCRVKSHIHVYYSFLKNYISFISTLLMASFIGSKQLLLR